MNGIRNTYQGPRRRRAPGGESKATLLRQNGSSGNASRNYERYLARAREAASAGDMIEAENCYQHAEHYFRVMRERRN